MTEKTWFSIEEVAEHLSVTRGAIHSWMKSGIIPYLQIKKTVRIHRDDLNDLIEENRYNLKNSEE